VAWAGVERKNRGMTESPPPIDEPLDFWVSTILCCHVSFIHLPTFLKSCENSSFSIVDGNQKKQDSKSLRFIVT